MQEPPASFHPPPQSPPSWEGIGQHQIAWPSPLIDIEENEILSNLLLDESEIELEPPT